MACLAGFAGDSAHRAVLLSLSSGQDALHLGRYGLEGLACLPGRQHPCPGAEAFSHGPDVLWTKVADAPVVLVFPSICGRPLLSASWSVCLVRQWIHIVRQFKEGVMVISHIFHVKVELWILRSIHASSCQHGRRGSGRFRLLHGSGMHFAGFAGEIAPRAVFPTIAAMTACTH